MRFLEKYIKDKENIKKYYMIGGGSFVVVVCILAFVIFLVSNFNFHVTSEAGKSFDVNKVWKKNFRANCTVAGTINTDEVGQYGCLVKVWGLIPMNVTVEVKDTLAPEVTLQEVALSYGEECIPEDFVVAGKDATGVTYAFVTEPDTKKLGEQTIEIKATDKYNNTSTYSTTLTVKGVIPSYTIEGGSELPPANVFVIDEHIDAVYTTEVDSAILSTVGEHAIQITVQGNVEDVTLVVEDTTAPTITTSEIKVVVNGSISYKKNIKVTDNCDEDTAIQISVDNSQVNLGAVGSYVIHCTATDAAGKTSTKDVTVAVVEPSVEIHTWDEIYGYADKILANIIDDSMSMYDKAYAIFKWTHGNIGYYSDAPTYDWLQGAYNGLVKRRGDCFAYASTSKVLLERIGLKPLVIEKEIEDWTYSSDHYWLLLDVGEGYYHFDATRRADGTCVFMWTDAELLEYSNSHHGSHNFSRDKYPKIQ